ncbi:hypothetical protein C8R44DRAFT_733112 [Mycena epipterygia]|nr:hypothetical protein C8R44DRAFT_733112 [Mycena epipterygia]
MPALAVVKFVLGAWNLGISGDLILQGVLFAQFAHYVALYKNDILALRVNVSHLLALEVPADFSFVNKSDSVVAERDGLHGYRAAVGLFATAWMSEANITFVALIAFYVQLFFCQRLWAISRKIYVVGAILALFVFALVAAIVSVLRIHATPVGNLFNELLVGIHLGIVFAGDAVLCGSTVYFLLAHSKKVLPETGGMLNAIVKLTFQSAAPAALCALLNLIGSQNIRLAPSHKQNTNNTEGTSGRRGRTNNVELGALSLSGNRNIVPIQVRTQVRTTQHADDMFSPKSPMEDMSENDERSTKN